MRRPRRVRGLRFAGSDCMHRQAMNARSCKFLMRARNELRSSCIVIDRIKEDTMRKLVLTIAAAAAFGLAVPAVTSTPASAETVIIKKGGHNHGWRHSLNRANKVVVIKRGRGHFWHG